MAASCLRIEDIDSPRVKPGAAEQACDDLRWLGLDWDGEPIVQTAALADLSGGLGAAQSGGTRLSLHLHARRHREGRQRAPRRAGRADLSGNLRRTAGRATRRSLGDRTYSWRFRAGTRRSAFHDGFRGPIALDLRDIGGDFVVWKSADTPAYQLAVVVDDAAQGRHRSDSRRRSDSIDAAAVAALCRASA